MSGVLDLILMLKILFSIKFGFGSCISIQRCRKMCAKTSHNPKPTSLTIGNVYIQIQIDIFRQDMSVEINRWDFCFQFVLVLPTKMMIIMYSIQNELEWRKLATIPNNKTI